MRKMHPNIPVQPLPQIMIMNPPLSSPLPWQSAPTAEVAHPRMQSTRQATHTTRRLPRWAFCWGERMSGTRSPQSSQSVPNSQTLYSAPSPPSSQTPSYSESFWSAHVLSQVMGGGETGGDRGTGGGDGGGVDGGGGDGGGDGGGGDGGGGEGGGAGGGGGGGGDGGGDGCASTQHDEQPHTPCSAYTAPSSRQLSIVPTSAHVDAPQVRSGHSASAHEAESAGEASARPIRALQGPRPVSTAEAATVIAAVTMGACVIERVAEESHSKVAVPSSSSRQHVLQSHVPTSSWMVASCEQLSLSWRSRHVVEASRRPQEL